MTRIEIYDIEAEEIGKIAMANDTSEAEVMEAIMTALEKNDIDLEEYL